MRWKLSRMVSDRGKVIEGCTVTPEYTPDNEVRFSLKAEIGGLNRKDIFEQDRPDQ